MGERETCQGRGLLEHLSTLEKDSLIKFDRLDTVLCQASEDPSLTHHWYEFGVTLFNSDTHVENVCYDRGRRVFMIGHALDWRPSTYEEVLSALHNAGQDIEWFTDQFFSLPLQEIPSVETWKEQIRKAVDSPVEEGERSSLKDILRENYRRVAEAWMDFAEIKAGWGWNDDFSYAISAAGRLAQKAGEVLDEGRVASTRSKHEEEAEAWREAEPQRMREEIQQRISEIGIEVQRSGYLNMEDRVARLIARARAVGIDLGFARSFAESITPLLLEKAEAALQDWTMSFLPDLPDERKHKGDLVRSFMRRASLYAEIANLDITERLDSLEERLGELETLSKLPQFLRWVVRGKSE